MNPLARTLDGARSSRLISLDAAAERGLDRLHTAPISSRILVEGILRQAHGVGQDPADAVDRALELADRCLAAARGGEAVDFDFRPGRLLLQDHSGVPVLADLAALRSTVANAGGKPGGVVPHLPVDLVVDHSVEAYETGRGALAGNLRREYRLNAERYRFLRWAQQEISGLRIVPPGRGIIHQVHLEHLARVVAEDATGLLAPDTVLGTDSHTPMVNAIGVLGWGVGGLDASSVLLGEPVALRCQPVVGVRLVGARRPGVAAMDIALTLAQVLREFGVVESMVEFCGPGLADLAVTDRATMANMAPEYGCTTTFFPVDDKVLEYLRLTGRSAEHTDLVERYCRAQGLFADPTVRRSPDTAEFARLLEFDLGAVEPSAAGPRRPQDRIPLGRTAQSFREVVAGESAGPGDGAVAIAAITSCTNTSNQLGMLTAGVLAANAVRAGLTVPDWVKTSLAPGSRAVTRYLEAAGLLEPLAHLGFSVVGYGCTTCIGNSGPLRPSLTTRDPAPRTVAVLSGNRNFEGRIHQDVAAAYLVAPAMVVAFALAGTVDLDITADPLGTDADGREVRLRDIWPSPRQLDDAAVHVTAACYEADGRELHDGDAAWAHGETPQGDTFDWPDGSTYFRQSPLVSADGGTRLQDIEAARVLVHAAPSTTTDHISPAGQIAAGSPAARHLTELGVAEADFNSYGCRRTNHEVMIRGTFAGAGLRNLLAGGRKGGVTRHLSSDTETTVYEAAMSYAQDHVPVIVLAGRDYGMGSSRDWAAKGPRLLGVRAVLAESFERIHRSNLIGAGILPLEFLPGHTPDDLGLTGHEEFDITGLAELSPRGLVGVVARDVQGARRIAFVMRARVETPRELDYLRHGGILGRITRSHMEAI